MRRALIGMIVVILAVAGALVGYPAGATPGRGQAVMKRAEALKKCKKDKSETKRKKCEATAKARYESKTETGGHEGTGTGTGTPAATGTGTESATSTGAATGNATTGPGEALSATVIVHVYLLTAPIPEVGKPGRSERIPEETQPLRMIRRGTDGEVASSIETSEHTLHVAPGSYEIQVIETGRGGGAYDPKDVAVTTGQTQEVTLEIEQK